MPPPGYHAAESLTAWRADAAAANDVLRLAAAVHELVQQPPRGGLGDDPRRSGIRPPGRDEPPPPAWLYLQLWRLVSEWLELGDVRPGLRTHWPRWPSLELQGAGLCGAVAVRLLLAVVQADYVVPCAACGALFTPLRWPRAGERSFCESCVSDRAPQRLAQRDYQRRRRAGARLREVLPTLCLQARDEADLLELLVEEARRAEPALPEEQLRRVAGETLEPPATEPTRGRKRRLAR
jgi:hypothetical protein